MAKTTVTPVASTPNLNSNTTGSDSDKIKKNNQSALPNASKPTADGDSNIEAVKIEDASDDDLINDHFKCEIDFTALDDALNDPSSEAEKKKKTTKTQQPQTPIDDGTTSAQKSANKHSGTNNVSNDKDNLPENSISADDDDSEFVDCPEDFGDNIFSNEDEDEDNQDSTYADQLNNLSEELENFKKKAKSSMKSSIKNDRLIHLLDVAEEMAKEIKKIQEIPVSPPEQFSKIRGKLEISIKNLVNLKKTIEKTQNSSSAALNSGVNATQTITTKLDLLKDMLSIIESNQQAFIKIQSPSPENKKTLDENIIKTTDLLEKIDSLNFPDNSKLENKIKNEIKLQLFQLVELSLELNSYESPDSKIKILTEKKLYVDAACAVFQSLLDDVPDDVKGKRQNKRDDFNTDAGALLQIFQRRSKLLGDCIATSTQPLSLGGSDDFTETSSELLKSLKKIYGKKFSDISTENDAHEMNWIPGMIDAFLEKYRKADTRSGKQLLKDAKSYVLNQQRDWNIIESEFLVPVSASSGSLDDKAELGHHGPEIVATGSAKVTTVTTPVGHVFKENKNLIDGDWKPIAENSLGEYQKIDHTGSKKKTITVGRNSHATTEHLHGVNVARTEVKVGDESLFSGTRHGTLSAYELYPDKLKKMGNEALKKMAKDLLNQRLPPESTNPFDDLPSELDKEWTEATREILPAGHSYDDGKIPDESIKAFIAKATSDEKFCALIRRRAALNRAREVFLSEALGNENMLARIRNGDQVLFTSTSLITPDPLRHFLARLFPSKFAKHNELAMRREEMQAWKDLQAEIDQGRCEIGGMTVKAKIISFSIGVNQLSLGSGSPLARSLTSGWNMVKDDNLQALTDLIGDPAGVAQRKFGGWVAEELNVQINAASNALKKGNRDAERAAIQKQNQIMELAIQLAEMWESGAYRRGGKQPYKFAARITLLSSLMNGGTAFSCKSGKDRTGHLDLEAKLLALQCQQRAPEGLMVSGSDRKTVQQNQIPPPYKGRTDFERYQLLSFIFKDRSRTEMQRYNTGAEGSKLNYWRELYDSFIPADENAEWIGEQFRGRSMGVEA